MFRKPHRVKSNTQLNGTERKNLTRTLFFHFGLTEDDLKPVFPPKEPLSSVKIIVTWQSAAINVITCQNTPYFFETEDGFQPTIFLLWKVPLVLPHIIVYPGVKEHLLNGADLMIPGIVPNQKQLQHEITYPGTCMYVCSEDNIAAVCVGLSLVKSTELSHPGNKGKGVKIYHTIGDELSKMVDANLKEPPFVGIPSEVTAQDDEFRKEQQEMLFKMQQNRRREREERVKALAAAAASACHSWDDVNDDLSDDDMSMEDLLFYCFAKGMKKYHSEITFPVLTNIFYKNCMLQVVPPNMHLDVKRTKYKKLSAFLSEMTQKKIITLEDNKGVQSLLSVDLSHSFFKTFKDRFADLDVKEDNSPKAMLVIEKSIINSHMEPICLKFNLRKGDTLTNHEVRRVLTNYIRAENLQDPYSKEFVALDEQLCTILQTSDLRMPWKNFFDNVLNSMSKCYEIRTPNNQVITGKGRLPPIEMTVAVKKSNKKVTLVKNLELYGINIQEFSKECQLGVAASSTVSALPNVKSSILQIQGNQKKFIGHLLQEKYLVPKNYIDGLEEQKAKKR